MTDIQFQKGHGIDCGCDNCSKIRALLRESEKQGVVHLAGLPEDLKKIRGS